MRRIVERSEWLFCKNDSVYLFQYGEGKMLEARLECNTSWEHYAIWSIKPIHNDSGYLKIRIQQTYDRKLDYWTLFTTTTRYIWSKRWNFGPETENHVARIEIADFMDLVIHTWPKGKGHFPLPKDL